MRKILKNKFVRILAVLLAAFCVFQLYKLIIIATNKDEIIYKHSHSLFLFSFIDVSDDNELKFLIDNYQGRGFLLLDNPFYDGERCYPKKRETQYVLVPEKYNITPDSCVRLDWDGSFPPYRKYIHEYCEEEIKNFNLSPVYVDFEVCGERCAPVLFEMTDGRQFIIYKKFNCLFMREVEE
ncbi:MAG: hypothetical protein IJ035_00750 [Oscillospiraceae bacterium]|nr:hypothetical protein [Oscillospiraceae bacterium]